MDDRIVPAIYTPEQRCARRPEGDVFLARDAHGLPYRLTQSHADAASSLRLRQGHLALMRLANPSLAVPLALEPLGDGRWMAVSEWLEPVPASPTLAELLSWLPGWLAGLGRLHQAGFVHGDLRPEAFGLAADGRAKLQGVGRGWRIGQAGQADASDSFAAPESRSRSRVDGRTDLYTLGAVCHFWLTGQVPVPGDAVGRDDWPEPLNALLEGLLAPHQARRFATAAQALAVLSGQGAARAAAPGATRHATPFVGRRAELDHLLEVASEVADDRGFRCLTIAGEPGVGKSRLMAEYRQRLVLSGFAVASASVGERTDGGAYSAWAALMPELLALVPATVAAELAPVLVALVPGLCDTPASALEPRAERMRLYRAIATLIEAAVEQSEASGDAGGLALFLDDWQRSDVASRELLDFLKRTLPALGVVLVLGSQDAPDEGEDGLMLSRFSSQEVGALVRSVWGDRGPDGGMFTELEEATCGHPALVEEAVLEAVGVAAGAGRSAGGPRAQLSVPATFKALWTRRLGGCSAPARSLASAASVAGARASVSLLRSVCGLEDTQFLAALDELVQAGVLDADAQGYTLAAPDAFAVEATPDITREHHAQALAYWRVAAQMGQPVPASLMAHHALESEDAGSGAYYALAAAKEALKLFALVEAGDLLGRGLACLETLSEVPDAWRLEYALVRGDHQRYMGQGAEAERYYREALVLAPVQPPARVPEILTSLGIALGLQSRSTEAEAAYREAIGHPALQPTTRARAATALARLSVRLGQADDAGQLCREVLEQDDAPTLYRAEALGLLGLMCITSESPRAVEGLRYLEEAQTLAEAAGDRLALNNACMLAGNARLALGQLPEARVAFERYYLLCQELGLADELVCATLNLAQVAFEEGRLTEAWERANVGAEAASKSGNRIYEAHGKIFAALAGCHLGHLRQAESAFAESLALAHQLGSDHLLLQVLLAMMEGALFLGRLGKAEELGLELERRQTEAGIFEFAGRHALLMGQLYDLCGEVETAFGYHQRARSLGEATGSATLLAGAQLGGALVALNAGQMAVAIDRAGEAMGLAEAAGAELARLQALLVLGRATLAMGDTEEAREHLMAADALARAIASPHWQSMTWLVLSQLGDEEAPLRQRAGVFLQFYLQQLPPRAKQEFLNWPDRREAVTPQPIRMPEAAAKEG